MSIFIFIILALILILLIVLFAYFYKRFPSQKEKTDPLVIKTEQIINDANENAEKIIKDAQLLSGKINEVYNNLSQKFEIEVANMYDRKIKELESNIKINIESIYNIEKSLINLMTFLNFPLSFIFFIKIRYIIIIRLIKNKIKLKDVARTLGDVKS